MNFPRATCKYCKADVVWATLSSSDKRLPFDFDPIRVGDGASRDAARHATHILYQDLGDSVVKACHWRAFDAALRPIYRERYIPHPVTCTRRT